MREIENIFETAYKEYKEYENFVKEIAPQIKIDRENYQKFVKENVDDLELCSDRLFDINEKPAHYQNDLLLLQNKLINYYEISKEVVKIPQEIKTEIEEFVKQQQIYTIKNGTAEEVNPQKNKEIREKIKEEYTKIVKNFIEKE